MLVNKGDPNVSPESAAFYGYVTTVDQAVTFLLVNGACSLSDRYGRKPFMAIANVGLGTGQVIASFAKDPRFLLLGSAIDGTQPRPIENQSTWCYLRRFGFRVGSRLVPD